MWKRAYKRIPTDIKIRFFSGPKEYYGTVTNLTEKGMFISTKVNFPLQPKLKIVIPWKREVLRVSALTRSFTRSGNNYNGIGVELLEPSREYLEFVNALRTATKILP